MYSSATAISESSLRHQHEGSHQSLHDVTRVALMSEPRNAAKKRKLTVALLRNLGAVVKPVRSTRR